MSHHDGYVGHFRMLVTLLSNAGCEVRVIGPALNSPVLPFVWKRISAGRLGPLRAAAYFLGAIFKVRPDAITFGSAGAYLNPLFALVSRLAGVKVLYDCQDPALEAASRPFEKSPLVGWIRLGLRSAEWLLARTVTTTLTVSPGLARILRSRNWTGRIEMFYNVHNAIECRDAVPGTTNLLPPSWRGAIVLVYIGGMQPGFRGLEEQIEAVKIARRAGRDIRLFAVCGSGFPEAFSDLVEPLVLENAYSLARNYSPLQVAQVIAESNIAVNKTLSYALPSKVFEYIAGGLTILSADVPSDVNDMCREFIVLYPDTVADLANALCGLEGRDRAPQRMSAKHFIERLWGHNVAVIESFVQTLRGAEI